MAIIGAASDLFTIRLGMADFYGEDLTKTFQLSGVTTDTAIEAILTDLNDITNAAFTSANVSSVRSASGFRAVALQALKDEVAQMIVLTFVAPHPLNATKTVTRTFTIPAYLGSLVEQSGALDYVRGQATPTTPQGKLGRIIDFLETRLVYEDITGAITVPVWEFDPSRSGAISTATVLDGN